jgi:hypothetical protein
VPPQYFQHQHPEDKTVPVCIADTELLTWQWHDADLRTIQIRYSAQGDLLVIMSTVINGYEDHKQLEALGIFLQRVDIQFRGVEQLSIASYAACDGQEVILDWQIEEAKPYHHRIRGSCGTIIELRAHEVWLQETD